MNYLVALSGFIPAVWLMAYVERHDAKRPEPKHLLRRVALFGGLSTLPCIGVQWALKAFQPEGAAGALFESYAIAGITEEGAKALCLYFAVWRSPAFDERFDGIVYATRAGLGFALVENIGYLVGAESVAGFVGMYVMRAVLAVPGHAIYAGFTGYWAAKARFDKVGPGWVGGLLIAVLLHGSYDAALFLIPHVPADLAVLYLPLLLVPVAVVIGGYRRLKKHAVEAIAKDDIAHLHPHEALPRLPFGMGFMLR